jgi:NTP pyrophosphatase (non-canonical NTP hydrolase)
MQKQESKPLTPETVFAKQARLSLGDSERWFPERSHSLVHHVLGLAGEAGEVANLVKKLDRGDFTLQEAAIRYDLAMELTDAYIYLLNIAALLGIDLSKSFDVKRAENEQRFGKGKK